MIPQGISCEKYQQISPESVLVSPVFYIFVFLGALAGTPANAITLNGVPGSQPNGWVSPVCNGSSTNLAPCNIAYSRNPDNGGNLTDGYRISWGNPATTDGQSSLTWEGPLAAINPIPLDGTAVNLGTLTHNNRIIFGGTALSGATLSLFFDFSNPDTDTTVLVPLTINETTNTPTLAGCPSFQFSSTPCDDQITLSSDTFLLNIPTTGNNFLAVQLFFENPSTGVPQSTITSAENNLNQLQVVGTFKEVPSPAPLGGLAFLSFLSRSISGLKRRYQLSS